MYALGMTLFLLGPRRPRTVPILEGNGGACCEVLARIHNTHEICVTYQLRGNASQSIGTAVVFRYGRITNVDIELRIAALTSERSSILLRLRNGVNVLRWESVALAILLRFCDRR